MLKKIHQMKSKPRINKPNQFNIYFAQFALVLQFHNSSYHNKLNQQLNQFS